MEVGIFTMYEDYMAEPDDFEEYYDTKVKKEGGRKTLWVPVVTNEDTVPEHDETFAVVFWDGDVFQGCVVTILDDAPEIIGVEIISEPVDGYAYRASESIDFTMNFDAEVDGDGDGELMLAIFIGDGDDSTWRGAEHHGGSGSRQPVFRYRAQTEDLDLDGVSAAEVADDRTAEYGFSGNIFTKGTDIPVDYNHDGVAGDSRQKVGGRPYVQSADIISSPSDGWDAYRANETIEVSMTFDTDVVVDGDVTVDLPGCWTTTGMRPRGRRVTSVALVPIRSYSATPSARAIWTRRASESSWAPYWTGRRAALMGQAP